MRQDQKHDAVNQIRYVPVSHLIQERAYWHLERDRSSLLIDEPDSFKKARKGDPAHVRSTASRSGRQIAPPRISCGRGVPIGQLRKCFVSVLCVRLEKAHTL